LAWLMFAPFVAAALLAVIVPPRWRRQEEIVGWGAFAMTGLGFALAKTIPAVHLLAVGAMGRLVGWDVRWLRDPEDLIALPALLVAWQVWKRAEARPPLRFRAGPVVLTLAVLATLADAPAPDYGISCLKQDGAKIVASGGYGSTFVSEDGGLTWRWGDNTGAPSGDCGQQSAWEMDDPANARVKYRFVPGAEIDRSEDGAETWKREVNLHEAEEVRAAFRRRQAYYDPTPGPADALIDSQTGNVIVAMRHEGVLIRDTNAKWWWITVGSYSRYEPLNLNDVLYLISGELWFALPLAFLVVNTMARPARATRRRLWDVVLGLAWAMWGFTLIGLQPAVNNWGYLQIAVAGFTLIVAVIALVVFLDETKQEIMMVRRHPIRAHEDGILTEKPLRKAS